MYKYGKIIALFATFGWLAFVFAAFKGFHFWYAGFVFFLWLALSSLNYRHDTSLWLLKNKFGNFLKFYIFLAFLSFWADYVVGQKITYLWIYPFYDSMGDWLRLYLIIYPFGGLSLLELVFFLGSMWGERFGYIHKSLSYPHKITDKIDLILDGLLIIIVLFAPLFVALKVVPGFRHFFVWSFIFWLIVATFKFRYHIRHSLHWFAIFIAALFMSVFLHEVPNTAVFEWRYKSAPILNQTVLDIPLWVVVGWYVLILLMLRFWMYFVLKKKQD